MVAAAAVTVVIGAGIAAAQWTASGSGTAGAKSTTFVPLTATATTGTATLYPGATGNAVVSISNPNPFPVTVTGISEDTTSYVTSGNGAACSDAPGSTHPTGVSLAASTGSLDTVPAGGTVSLTLTRKVSMSSASDTGCQGAAFTIPITVTASS